MLNRKLVMGWIIPHLKEMNLNFNDLRKENIWHSAYSNTKSIRTETLDRIFTWLSGKMGIFEAELRDDWKLYMEEQG